MTNGPIDSAWLDAALRASRSPEIDDAGFSAGVLARIAAPSPTLPPQAALAALRHAEHGERRYRRWTMGGALSGAAVAAAACLAGVPTLAVSTVGADVAALFLVSCGLAWLELSGRRDDTAW